MPAFDRTKYLVRALEELHTKAFFLHDLNFKAIKFNKDLSIELFYLYKWAMQLKLRTKNHNSYSGETDTEVEEITARGVLCFMSENVPQDID